MKSGAALVGFLFSFAVGGAVGYSLGVARKSDAQKTAPTAEVQKGAPTVPGVPGASDVLKVPVGTSAQKGPSDALVTIVEFSDFQCPFCSRVGPTIKQIEDLYGKDVRILFKHEPLPFHQQAPLASEYALAALEQGKFWEMHDKLFANQQSLDPESLKRYARELGLDEGRVNAFIESGKGKAQIKEDSELGRKLGATGTPAFFINGVKLSGAQPLANFQKIIDQELAKAKKLVESGTSRAQVYETIMKTAREVAPPPPQQQAQQQPPQTRQNVALVDGTPAKGGKNPLVTMVMWSDFECPFCSRVVPTLQQIHKEYGDKVLVQFRNQPLPFHKRAMPAAKAGLAAHKQGKFWEMHDKLFANQRALEDADLERYAGEVGLNVNKFKADMASTDLDATIKRDMDDGTKYGARGTPTLFANGVPIRGAQPFEAFKATLDKEIELADKMLKEGVKKTDLYAEILKREGGKVVGPAPGAPSAGGPPPVPEGPVSLEIGRAPLFGDKNAPIKVIVFSDFECPFCSRVNPSIAELKKLYGSKVAVAFKHYPLGFHKNAELAAVASLAAHKQGKFWEMHDKLFENQRALARENLVAYAKDLSLNMSKFETDLDDPSLKAWIQSDMQEATKVGVSGTPATFINGRKIVGAQPVEAFKAIVDEELKKKS